MFVKPAPGLTVRVPPHMRPLPPGGGNVPDITYWHRAIARGDVILAPPPAEPHPAPEPSAA